MSSIFCIFVHQPATDLGAPSAIARLSHEVSGIIPDLLVGLRANDSPAFKARLVVEKLPAAVPAAAR